MWEDKSWTWVNERRCDECGFDASSTRPHDVVGLLEANLSDWRRLLGGDVERLLTRPDDTTWSATEYACHVRDVYTLLAYRIARVLTEPHPTFEDWHPDARAVDGAYSAERDPASVLAALTSNGEGVIADVDALTDDDWQRLGTRADGVVFTLAWLSTYLTHDVIHHVTDAERGLAIVDARGS